MPAVLLRGRRIPSRQRRRWLKRDYRRHPPHEQTDRSIRKRRAASIILASQSKASPKRADFYEALGLRVTHEETVEHEGVRVAMIPLGESRVELLEPLGPETPSVASLASVALDCIMSRCTSMTSTPRGHSCRRAERHIVSPAIQTGAGGHLYFFVHPKSTGGVLLEICQDPA